MARRSLRPHLNQIRTWVRQGRTDAWIAHQLEVTVQQIEAFKRENELSPASEDGDDAAPATDFDDEIDLRAEDDALIAAELEAAEARRREEAEEQRRRDEEEAAARAAEAAARAAAGEVEGEADEDGDAAPRRRRGRRGGRGRRRTATAASTFEGTFDHGEEGYGLWLDPAVADTPVYAEHWAGHRPVEVTVEEDQIVIRRAGGDEDEGEGEGEDE